MRPYGADGVPDGRLEDGYVDRDLVESAQHGDQAAFVDLIRSRVDRLYATAQRILRDVDRAEDALQDALVIAWRDLRGLRDPDRFDAWLYRLVVRECIDQGPADRADDRRSAARCRPSDTSRRRRRASSQGAPRGVPAAGDLELL